MFASIRTYRIKTGSLDDVLHRVDRDLADAFAREPGFISYEVVRTGERTLASITTLDGSFAPVMADTTVSSALGLGRLVMMVGTAFASAVVGT